MDRTKLRGMEKVTPEQAARDALEARRETLLRRRELSASEGREARSKRVCDPMERASLADEGERLLHLNADEARRLAEVEAALARLDAGTWGECEVCEEPIEPRRLAHLPEARRCLACASEAERGVRGRGRAG